jgi:RNA polymerase sigma-54 factor
MGKGTGWIWRTLNLLTLSKQELEAYIREQAEANPWLDVVPLAPEVAEDLIVAERGEGFEVTFHPGVRVRLRSPMGEARDREQRQRWEAARGLVHALAWRAEVLLSIARAIVEQQADFLSGHCDWPRRLRLRSLAQRVNLHESTVGRATRNKIILTPRGRFSLRFLVNPRTHAETLVEAIRAILAAEDPQAPLSDAEIARRLADAGWTVARRTVSKYRRSAGLPAKRRRRT